MVAVCGIIKRERARENELIILIDVDDFDSAASEYHHRPTECIDGKQ
jgi:hypothetical protein